VTLPSDSPTLLVLGFLAGCWSLACGPETPAAPPEGLRVMTYNIAAGRGDLAVVADTICAAGADVVGLQEVDVHWGERSGFADQAVGIADRCGMDFRFAPIYTLPPTEPGRAPRQYGLAILSRHPITGWENHTITRLSTQADTGPEPLPGFLEVTLDVGGTAVRVFDTHLDYREDPAVRRLQVEEMLGIIGDDPGATVLLGDMNAPPERDELAPLFLRFRDAWQGNPDPGFTYPAEAPVRRIDYVFHSGPLQAVSARVVPGAASDHRAVVVDFLLGTR
jgi:endonuclease/exonuclease/phosphatase family metal-dependent hydrolase